MEEKDDFDVFLEEAQEIVKKIENGEDVEILTENLKLSASLIDPSTVPSTSINPNEFCRAIQECAKKSTPPRRRHQQKIEEEKCESTPPNPSPPQSSSSSSLRVKISIFLTVSIGFIYWLRLPAPCKHPIW